jgi:hypothetical protein
LGLFGSLALHGLVIAATLFTFSHRLDIVDESAPVVPVDLVTLASKTNVRAMERAAPKIVPDVKPVLTPPTPVQTQAPPPDDSEAPPPEQASSEPLISKPPPLPVPRVKPQTVPKDDKKKFDVDSVFALLDKRAPAPSRSNAHAGPRDVRGAGDQSAMTADLASMMESMIKPCWSPPVGAPHPESLIVHFDVVLNADGSVSRVTQLPGQSGNPYFQAAAEAARRAIFVCQPYKLPSNRYELWKEIEDFEFDPRTMMGE